MTEKIRIIKLQKDGRQNALVFFIIKVIFRFFIMIEKLLLIV